MRNVFYKKKLNYEINRFICQLNHGRVGGRGVFGLSNTPFKIEISEPNLPQPISRKFKSIYLYLKTMEKELYYTNNKFTSYQRKPFCNKTFGPLDTN